MAQTNPKVYIRKQSTSLCQNGTAVRKYHQPNETRWQGPAYALLSACLFGASTPFAKILLGRLEPLLLAGLLYLGSGVGLSTWVVLRRSFGDKESREARLRLTDIPWLASAILSGGIVGPILLLIGLRLTPASSASLLLNLEGVL